MDTGAPADAPPSPGVLVVGMHRSGTSALTRVVSLLGLELTAEDDLWPGTWANTRGHFESISLTHLNADLVRELGGRWSAPPPIVPEDIDHLVAEHADDARERFTSSHPGTGWVWKDPRLSLLLPFWRQVLDGEPTAVLSLRHPLEVAGSLQRRDGLSIGFALLVWERYQRAALRSLAGLPTAVVRYDDLLRDPEGTASGLAAFLGPRTGASLSDEARQEIGDFLDGEERHFTNADDELDSHPEASPEQAALYRTSLDLVGDHDPFPVVELPPETPGLQRALDEHLRFTAALEERDVEHAAERAALEGEVEFLRTECDRRSEQASALAEEVMARREEVESLQASLDRIHRLLPVRIAGAVRRRLRR